MNNTTPNTVGSKKYVSISSPGLGGSQTMQNSQGYNFKNKQANSPNNYNSQGQNQIGIYSNNVNTSMSNNTSG
jgi:hypothetical protein